MILMINDNDNDVIIMILINEINEIIVMIMKWY